MFTHIPYSLLKRYIYNVFFIFRKPLPDINGSVTITLDVQHPDLLSVKPSSLNITTDQTEWTIYVEGLNAGHSIVSANVTPKNVTE